MSTSQELRDAVQTLRRTPMALSTMIPLLQKAADEIDRLEKSQPITRGEIDIQTGTYDKYPRPCEILEVMGDCLKIRYADHSEYVVDVVKQEEVRLGQPLEYWVVKMPNGTYQDKGGGSSAPCLFNSATKARAKTYKHGTVKKWIMKEVDA